MATLSETVKETAQDVKEIKVVLIGDEYRRFKGLVQKTDENTAAISNHEGRILKLEKTERKNKWWRRLQYAGSAGGGGLLTWIASKGWIGKLAIGIVKLFS